MKVRLSELIFIFSVSSFIIRVVVLWICPVDDRHFDAPLSVVPLPSLPTTTHDLHRPEHFPTTVLLSILNTPDELEFVEFFPNTVLLAITNTGYLVLTKNLITSLEIIGLGKYLTVVSFEADASQSLLEMKEFTGRVHQLGSEEPTSLETAELKSVGRRKILAIKYYLSRGHNVLYMDSDISVFRDFRDILTEDDRNTYDAILQDDSTNQEASNWFKPCTGFMYLRASTTTLNFTDLERHARLWDRTRDEQSYLKEFLQHWKIKPLPKAQFLSGWWLTNVVKTRRRLRQLRILRRVDKAVYLVHMNNLEEGVDKARQHWRYGTFFYDGPGAAELLDLENNNDTESKRWRPV